MGIEAGRLRHRVDIQTRTDTQDAVTGEVTTEWATLHSAVPAEVAPLSVKEYLQSGTEQTQISARITLRYRAGLNHTMRILHRGRIYNPAGVLADRDSGLEYLTIPCSEGVNEG